MKIYLDLCALNRPFDKWDNYRIKMEAEAVNFIIHGIINGFYILVNSDVIEYEWSKIPMLEKKSLVKKIIDLAKEKIPITTGLIKMAKEFEEVGIKALDALHLAASITGKCDYFITTDDKFLKKAKTITAKVRVCNPVEYYLHETMN